jgi:hypothetical protein
MKLKKSLLMQEATLSVTGKVAKKEQAPKSKSSKSLKCMLFFWKC